MEERVMSMNRTICVYGEQQQQQKEGRSRREEKTMPVHWVSGTPSTQVAVPVPFFELQTCDTMHASRNS